jgi:hypothetical protein
MTIPQDERVPTSAEIQGTNCAHLLVVHIDS